MINYFIKTGKQFGESTLLSCIFSWGQENKQNIIQYFLPWTFPKLNTHPRFSSFPEKLVWIAAIKEEEILGFALINPHSIESEILSFKIHPEYRNQGIATVFLQQVEQLCASRRIQSLKISYRTYWKDNPYWEKVLQKSEWENRTTLLYYISLEDTTNTRIASNILYQNWSENQQYQIETFSYDRLLTSMQHTQWEEAKKMGLSPFQLSKSQVDFDCSFLIINKKNDAIVGWLICHQLKADLIQLTTFYILPKHRKAGKAAISKLAKKIKAKNVTLHFMVKADNHKIMAFVKRYLLTQGGVCHEQVLIKKVL
ncbi:MAG: GNAT family N-acetyltransferase [Bacteroidota bacterium]